MNMSYCQFENTVRDLQQVLDTLRSCNSLEELIEDSSSYEQNAIRDLPYVCRQISERYRILQGE